jgi:ACS family allantoate permease-like MFS transporter
VQSLQRLPNHHRSSIKLDQVSKAGICLFFPQGLTRYRSLVGSILVRFGPNQGSRLFGLWLFVAFAAGFPISLSMVASNVAGFTKKSVASAMLFMAYTAGNIVGPFLFFPREAPDYPVSKLHPYIIAGLF